MGTRDGTSLPLLLRPWEFKRGFGAHCCDFPTLEELLHMSALRIDIPATPNHRRRAAHHVNPARLSLLTSARSALSAPSSFLYFRLESLLSGGCLGKAAAVLVPYGVQHAGEDVQWQPRGPLLPADDTHSDKEIVKITFTPNLT